MECKCSLDNGYEVIGMCKLEEFNQRITEFEDKSWNQIKLSNTLNIDIDKPLVKNIIKTYIDIEITSNKIIDTPKSENQSLEGFKATGKKLIVSGSISQRVIYTSNDCSQKNHSIKFKDNFSSYIVIEGDVDVEFDRFCVYPFIEDLSLKPLEGNKIYRNITLFLFASKIEAPITINNEFVFYQYTPVGSTKEVVRVGFNGNNRTLIATSGGNPYNSDRDYLVLKFALLKGKTLNSKVIGIVNQNEDGTEFVSMLNGFKFKVGDLISIGYQVTPNVKLTNYPLVGSDYFMNFVPYIHFEITKDGVVPYSLPNVISLKSSTNQVIFTIGFDRLTKRILPYETLNRLADPSSTAKYFEIVGKRGGAEQYRASMNGNQTAFALINDLHLKYFEYGDTIELYCKDSTKVEITNNPYPGSSKYTLSGNNQTFRITESGLVAIP